MPLGETGPHARVPTCTLARAVWPSLSLQGRPAQAAADACLSRGIRSDRPCPTPSAPSERHHQLPRVSCSRGWGSPPKLTGALCIAPGRCPARSRLGLRSRGRAPCRRGAWRGSYRSTGPVLASWRRAGRESPPSASRDAHVAANGVGRAAVCGFRPPPGAMPPLPGIRGVVGAFRPPAGDRWLRWQDCAQRAVNSRCVDSAFPESSQRAVRPRVPDWGIP